MSGTGDAGRPAVAVPSSADARRGRSGMAGRRGVSAPARDAAGGAVATRVVEDGADGRTGDGKAVGAAGDADGVRATGAGGGVSSAAVGAGAGVGTGAGPGATGAAAAASRTGVCVGPCSVLHQYAPAAASTPKKLSAATIQPVRASLRSLRSRRPWRPRRSDASRVARCSGAASESTRRSSSGDAGTARPASSAPKDVLAVGSAPRRAEQCEQMRAPSRLRWPHWGQRVAMELGVGKQPRLCTNRARELSAPGFFTQCYQFPDRLTPGRRSPSSPAPRSAPLRCGSISPPGRVWWAG